MIIKPPKSVIVAVAEQSQDMWNFPYQYMNWALSKLNKEPNCKVGDKCTIRMILDLYDACCLELEQEDVL